MSAGADMMSFPVRLKSELKLDPVLLTIVMALLLGGLVMLASASITVSDNLADRPFFYVERQLLATGIGLAGAIFCLFVPMRIWQGMGLMMLLLALVLLTVVLVPGLGMK